ncbi:hypothetical protein BKA67DRAFT_234039 [Truncatella angustata]|uniref:Uncharacterized protein n=1 Tax=Truncatella angustata TaxID=152316 RepID=A0A9P8UND1_9PEZI|nr:uncharacterized protein BKA67DRAFT_234039 [Truncatella angustata]KAH6655335.1 hypothetical protein BKA67DRAFT_234039 [Truncatella angustata]
MLLSYLMEIQRARKRSIRVSQFTFLHCQVGSWSLPSTPSLGLSNIPGEQFWLRYDIIRTPPLATHLYFKMYMNGAAITSWGLPVHAEKNDRAQRSTGGTVVRALYEPGEIWHHMSTDVEGRSVGIEMRHFHFMPGSDKKSVAEDGGLIEILVFRSQGRRRRAPKMFGFRSQEKYGIASPTGGLVEDPQDATFYDWLLIDPKDAPFASFRFHYRSMKHLLQLNLVPQSESRPQLPKTDAKYAIDQVTPVSANKTSNSRSPVTPNFSFEVKPLLANICHDSRDRGLGGTFEHREEERYFMDSSLEPFPSIAADQHMHQPAKISKDPTPQKILHRPLPEPPRPRSRHTSQSSVRSTCPSLTPSLVNYVENGELGDEDIKIGTAHTVLCSVPSMVELPCRVSDVGEGNSFSDYERSPPSSVTSLSQYLPSPERYLSTTGSVLEHQIAQFTSPPILQPSPRRIRSRIPTSVSEMTLFGGGALSSPGTLSLSESEWMRRTPSPVQRKPFSRLWSPRLGKKLGNLVSQDHRRRSRYSDIGPYPSNESLGGVGREPGHSPTIKTTAFLAQDASDDAITPRAAQFPDHVRGEVNSEGRDEVEAIEKPIGNWI